MKKTRRLLGVLGALWLYLNTSQALGLTINGCTIEPYAACSGAELDSADLSYVDLSYADLTFASFWFTNLTGATLTGTSMSYADLTEAVLAFANLSGADLSYAFLNSADLSFADLRSANLGTADLSYAELTYAIYDNNTVFPSGFDPAVYSMTFAPVPLPAAAWLFVTGLISLAGITARKKPA